MKRIASLALFISFFSPAAQRFTPEYTWGKAQEITLAYPNSLADTEGKTALHHLLGCAERLASQEGWTEGEEIAWRKKYIKELLNKGVPLTQDNEGNTPYHDAAKTGLVELIAFLLDLAQEERYHTFLVRTINFDTQNSLGQTPLHLLSREALTYLLTIPTLQGRLPLDTPDKAGLTVRALAEEIKKELAKKEARSPQEAKSSLNLEIAGILGCAAAAQPDPSSRSSSTTPRIQTPRSSFERVVEIARGKHRSGTPVLPSSPSASPITDSKLSTSAPR